MLSPDLIKGENSSTVVKRPSTTSKLTRGKGSKKDGMMRGIDDALIDHDNDNKWAMEYFPCPLHNQNKIQLDDS